MSAADDAVLLRARELTRRFGGLVAVDRVSIELARGAGARGDRHQRRRQVHADQRAVGRAAGHVGHGRAARRRTSRAGRSRSARAPGIGRSYQRNTIFPHFTVLENCRLAAQARHQQPWALVAEREHAAPSRCPRRATPPRAPGWPTCWSARPARCRTASSASSRSRCAWPPNPRCCCSTSRWPAWAPRRPSACCSCSAN